MPIVVNRSNGNLNTGDTENIDLTGDDNGIIFSGLALDTGGIASFGIASIGADSFVTDASHDVENPFGTQVFITASGVVVNPSASGNQNFTQNITGTFNGNGFDMLDVSGLDQTTPLKEISAINTYNNAVPSDHSYNVDNGGLVRMIVSTNVGVVPASIAGWIKIGSNKAISIMSSVATYYRIATSDEIGSTVNPMNGSSGRGFSQLWVFNASSGAPADTTSPILSLPTTTVPTSVGFKPEVTTDEDNGTMYCVAVPDGDIPSVSQIKLGLQSNGTAANFFATVTVSTAGVVSFSNILDLDMGTSYELYFVHTDAAGNDSTSTTLGASTNTFGLGGLVENYTVTSGVLISPHAASNSSGVGFDEETNRIGIIRNNSAVIHEYDATDLQVIKRTITCNGNFGDMESVTYMGGGEIAVGAENGGGHYVYIYDLPPGDVDITITPKQLLTLSDNATDNNSTTEGLTYDKVLKVFWSCDEGEQANTPRKIFRFARPLNTTTDYTYTDAEFTVEDNPFDPEVLFASYGATGATFDLSGLSMDMTTGHLLFISDTGKMVIQVNVDDTANPIIVSELPIPLVFQPEGIEVIDNGRLLIIGEANQYMIRELSSTVIIAINQIVETNLSQVLSIDNSINISIGTVEETNLSESLVMQSVLESSINQVTELEISQALDFESLLLFTLNQVIETSTSTSLNLTQAFSSIINQALETVDIQVLTPVLILSKIMQTVEEINTNFSVTSNSSTIEGISQIQESNLGQSIISDLALAKVVGLVSELSELQIFGQILSDITILNSANETDEAITLSSQLTNVSSIIQVTETNNNFSINSFLSEQIVLQRAEELDQVFATSIDLLATIVLTQAIEQTEADAISLLLAGATLIDRVTETNLSFSTQVRSSYDLNINQVQESDLSNNISVFSDNTLILTRVDEACFSQPLIAEEGQLILPISRAQESGITFVLSTKVDAIQQIGIAQELNDVQLISVSLGSTQSISLVEEVGISQSVSLQIGEYTSQINQVFEIDVSFKLTDPFSDVVNFLVLRPIKSYKVCNMTSYKNTKMRSEN